MVKLVVLKVKKVRNRLIKHVFWKYIAGPEPC